MRVLKYGQINDMPYEWKKEEKWHDVLYHMWWGMWERIYTNINYFGKTIQPKYKNLSGYLEDIQKLENFDLFKENPKGWCIDKDIKGGHLEGYYFEYLSLITKSENSVECNKRTGSKQLFTKATREKAHLNKRRPIIGINIKDGSFLIFDYVRQSEEYGFNPSHIVSCIKGVRKSHKGYKWEYYKEANNGRENC